MVIGYMRTDAVYVAASEFAVDTLEIANSMTVEMTADVFVFDNVATNATFIIFIGKMVLAHMPYVVVSYEVFRAI